MDDLRLERIEKKLDQMGEAIVVLAPMEERMDTLDQEQTQHGRRNMLVPLLTAALQEALTEIASLKARLDAANL